VAFRGTYDHTLDAKNRLTIPARYRSQLADGVVLTQPADGSPCLQLWRPADLERSTGMALDQFRPGSRDRETLVRFYNSRSQETELDGAGRVMVPSFLAEKVGLGREVVVIGAGERLEIWDRPAWSEYEDRLDPQSIIAQLDHPA
jgi:MraZ protein